MTREDAISGVMLTVLCLVFWITGFDGRAPGSPAEPQPPPACPSHQRLAWEFGAGRGAFRFAAPPSWVWTNAADTAADPAGWRALGGFREEHLTLEIAWRRLDREIRVEDWIRYECRNLRLSESRVHAAAGRRPRTILAEVWDEESGSRRPGCLALSKLGDRLYRLRARISPSAPPGTLATLRETLATFQPLGSVASTCAEELTTWRPFFGSELAVPYPSSWSPQDGPSWRQHPLLHLRSRSEGKNRGAMLLCALEAREAVTELTDARLDELVGVLAERERGLAIVEAQVWVDTEADSERLSGPGRLRILRLLRDGDPWEVQVRILTGAKAALVLMLATPQRESNPLAWMIHRAAFDLAAEEAREE